MPASQKPIQRQHVERIAAEEEFFGDGDQQKRNCPKNCVSRQGCAVNYDAAQVETMKEVNEQHEKTECRKSDEKAEHKSTSFR